LEAEAAFEPCMETFKTIALDMEEAMLPAGHYLGARMVQAMAQVHPRSRILACIKRLDEFLPAYQAAARKVGGFTFNEALIGRFSEFWR